MRRVLLIVVATGCWGKPPVVQPAPAAPLPPTVAAPPVAPAETLWDQGTFVTVGQGQPLAGYEETFTIARTADGYRFDIRWKRPGTAGPNDGQATMTTDNHLTPITGEMISTDHEPSGDKATRSTITREPDGLLTTEVIAADGEKQTNHAAARSDWFIGGSLTTFLVALCQADANVTNPIVYPGKQTTLSPAQPLRVEGVDRHVVMRHLEYVESHRQVNAACEDGKIMGEHTAGLTVVRKGDMALATALGGP